MIVFMFHPGEEILKHNKFRQTEDLKNNSVSVHFELHW